MTIAHDVLGMGYRPLALWGMGRRGGVVGGGRDTSRTPSWAICWAICCAPWRVGMGTGSSVTSSDGNVHGRGASNLGGCWDGRGEGEGSDCDAATATSSIPAAPASRTPLPSSRTHASSQQTFPPFVMVWVVAKVVGGGSLRDGDGVQLHVVHARVALQLHAPVESPPQRHPLVAPPQPHAPIAPQSHAGDAAQRHITGHSSICCASIFTPLAAPPGHGSALTRTHSVRAV